jgi:hypothetical protein
MDRINSTNMATLMPGSRRGWQDQNLANGVSGTEFNAVYQNAVQEELMAVIEGVGLTADAGNWTQLLQALKRLTRSSYQYIPYSVYGGAVTISPDWAGRMVINAFGGNMTIYLPDAASINGVVATVASRNSLTFEIFREDSSANTVTLVAASGDNFQFAGVSSGTLQIPPLATAELFSDTANTWLVVMPPVVTLPSQMQPYTVPGSYSFTIPFGRTSIRARLTGSGGGGGGSNGTGSAGGAGAGAAEALFNIPVTPGETLTIVVGAGGAGGTSAPTAGGTGADTYIARGATVLAKVSGGNGGAAGSGGTIASGGLTPGAVTAGTPLLTAPGTGGGSAQQITSTVYINAQGGAPNGVGSAPHIAANGATPLLPGCGGEGGTNTGNGASGAPGRVILEW